MKKYKTEFSNKELHEALHSKDKEAKSIISDENKWKSFKISLMFFLEKAKKIPVLGGVLDDIECMIYLVNSYIKKEYTEIPLSSIISIVAALVYLLSPIDLIPDIIPGIGYIDDVAIITLIINFGIGKDLKKYREWNEKNTINKVKSKILYEINTCIGENYLAALILTSDNHFKMILSKTKETNDWSEYFIKELYVPSSILDFYGINKDDSMLRIVNDILKTGQVQRTKKSEKSAYREFDFFNKWDNYIIRED